MHKLPWGYSGSKFHTNWIWWKEFRRRRWEIITGWQGNMSDAMLSNFGMAGGEWGCYIPLFMASFPLQPPHLSLVMPLLMPDSIFTPKLHPSQLNHHPSYKYPAINSLFWNRIIELSVIHFIWTFYWTDKTNAYNI